MAKNLFYMHTPLITGFGSEHKKNQKWITLIPVGFNGLKRDIKTLEFMGKYLKTKGMWNSDIEKYTRNRMQRIENNKMIYTNSFTSFMSL